MSSLRDSLMSNTTSFNDMCNESYHKEEMLLNFRDTDCTLLQRDICSQEKYHLNEKMTESIKQQKQHNETSISSIRTVLSLKQIVEDVNDVCKDLDSIDLSFVESFTKKNRNIPSKENLNTQNVIIT